MCKTHNPRKIDRCMRHIVSTLGTILEDHRMSLVACCCGHRKYNPSLICNLHSADVNVELFSNIIIPRKKRFYVKDKQGYYYIPECVDKNV